MIRSVRGTRRAAGVRKTQDMSEGQGKYEREQECKRKKYSLILC